MESKTFDIEGMSCASCAQTIEKGIEKRYKGVENET